MQSKFIFENVEFFGQNGVTSVRVRKGDVFIIQLTDDSGKELPAHELVWMASNDPVLKHIEQAGGNESHIEATALGLSQIQVQYSDRSLAKEFHITVFDPQEAATLNVVAGVPKLK